MASNTTQVNEPETGSSRLYKTAVKTIKLGSVTVTKDDILEVLPTCMRMGFRPVTLKPKEGKYDSLSKALCGQSVSFSKAFEYVTTHIDLKKSVPCKTFFFEHRTAKIPYEEIAVSLFTAIKHEIIHHFDVGMEESVQGQSAEKHKEMFDKYSMCKLLVSLSGDEALNVVSFGDEVLFKPPNGNFGPNGSIDLLIGSKQSYCSNADLEIKLVDDVIIGISNATLSETKNSLIQLSRAKTDSEDLLAAVSQPVLVLLSVAQASKASGPHLLFYGNGHHIRPFVYYKSVDILLTTNEQIPWKDENEGVLDLIGVCLVGLLLRTNRAVRFVDEGLISDFLITENSFPPTGFIDAMTIDLTKAVLKCTFVSEPRKVNKIEYKDIFSIEQERESDEKWEAYISKKRKVARKL